MVHFLVSRPCGHLVSGIWVDLCSGGVVIIVDSFSQIYFVKKKYFTHP